MIFNRILISTFLLTLIFLFGHCDSTEKKIIPDISHIPAVKVEFNRFEQKLFSLDTNNLKNDLKKLEATDPVFFNLYMSNILRLKHPMDTTQKGRDSMEYYLHKYVLQPTQMRHLYDTIQTVFGDISDVQAELEEGFRFMKYYLPNQPTPKVYTFLSEYSVGAATAGEDIMLIGLDMYFGEKYGAYYQKQVGLYQYITKFMTREHISVQAMKSLITNELVGEQKQGDKLLDAMIHNGKTLYILSQFLPNKENRHIMQYSPKQMMFCETNEKEMWQFFISQNLLYSTDYKTFRKYVDVSPSSPNMPEGAPGRTANWMGWQIIKAYMKRNPTTTMEQLIQLNDAQLILNKSKYKP